MKVRKAIIPAAGLGTRFLPATKALPKEMLPIIDKPTIQFIVEEAVASGIDDIIIVTGKGKRAIEDHFDHAFELEYQLQKKGKQDLLMEVQKPSRMIDIHYIRQKEPKGLGHAIWCARKFINNEPFAVLLGDTFIQSEVPSLKQMMINYDRYKNSIIGVQQVRKEQVSSYGVIGGHQLHEGFHSIHSLVEKPNVDEAPSDLAILGRYILTPAIFNILERLEAGVNGEIQLTDAISMLNREEAVYGCEIQGIWHDVGDHWGYVKSVLTLASQRLDLRANMKEFVEELYRNDNPEGY